MGGTRKALAAVIAALLVLVWQFPENPRAESLVSSQTLDETATQHAVMSRYCSGCHNSRVSTPATASGVVFDHLDLNHLADNPALWEKVLRKLRTGAMPPEGSPRPDPPGYAALSGFIESHLDRAAMEHPNPGRPLIHRLNRAEYANAIRDLLALEVDTAALLPADDTAEGFDNIADALSLSPALLERYLAAAAKISALAVGSPRISASSETYRVRGDVSQTEHLEGMPLGTRGGVAARHTFPLDGEYVIRVKLAETNLGTIRGLQFENQLEITVDGERVLLAPVGGEKDYLESGENATNMVNDLNQRLQARVKVRAGQRPVSAGFVEPSSALGPMRLQDFLRSTIVATDHLGLPHVEYMTISGPFNASGPGDTPNRQRVFICRPTREARGLASPKPQGREARGLASPKPQGNAERPCATTMISKLARRAYRRPVTDSDMSGLLRFYDEGRQSGGFDAGIEMALRAMLASPKFLFRAERDPAGSTPGSVHAVSDLELASRLSFFIWSSIPDDELLSVAEAGRLRDPQTLARQVRRMLADAKSEALVTNFPGQWLQIRNLRSATPDKNDFPDFDDTLRQAFERELYLFVGSIIREDRSALELLTADYTFVNERLARHYGIPYIYGSHFRRISGIDETRRGLLGKGGILLVTSHADRTSPVVRGKWILENLVGAPPPPPPPDVPPLPDVPAARPQTMRARMEEHRANPVCASCHKVMDPMGLAMENFDAVGAWRADDGGKPVDATGQLTDGTKIDGVAGLRATLLKRPDVLATTITEKLLTYALGRGLGPEDMPAVRAIVRQARSNDYRFVSLIEGVVNSAPFRMRKSEEKL
jgi:mono/diheme cytochrome c family protein